MSANPLLVATDGLLPDPTPLSIATRGYIQQEAFIADFCDIAEYIFPDGSFPKYSWPLYSWPLLPPEVLIKHEGGTIGVYKPFWKQRETALYKQLIREDEEMLAVILQLVMDEVI